MYIYIIIYINFICTSILATDVVTNKQNHKLIEQLCKKSNS